MRLQKKTFGSVVSVVIIIRTRGADQGGNKSGNGREIRKDCAQRFGVCNELIKSVPDLENTYHQKRGYGPGRKYGRREFQRKNENGNTTRRRSWEKAIRRAFFTEFIISAQMNHQSSDQPSNRLSHALHLIAPGWATKLVSWCKDKNAVFHGTSNSPHVLARINHPTQNVPLADRVD